MAMSLCFLITKSHGFSPYLVVFNQEPILPTAFHWVLHWDALPTLDGSAAKELLDWLLYAWRDLCHTVTVHLAKNDERMKGAYL